MNFTCNECNDTGSRDKLGTYLDCNACGTAATRRDLNDFVKSLTQRSTYPVHPEDVALAIHQRALAMVMSASVEDTLNEMQPGGALHMPQEPVAHLKFWAAQSWSGNGNHDIDCGEGLEVCEPGEIGADGLPAFPVFMHAIPGALAMAPKQEALPESLPEMTDDLIFQWAEGYVFTLKGMPHKMTFSRPRFVQAVRTIIAHLPAPVPAPAAANGALTDEQIEIIGRGLDAFRNKTFRLSQGQSMTRPEQDEYDAQINFARAILAAAGPACKDIKPWKDRAGDLDEYGRPYERDIEMANAEIADLRAALSGAKGN